MNFLPADEPRRQALARCESPIERMFCEALLVDIGCTVGPADCRIEDLPDARPCLFVQHKIRRFRVDFLIIVKTTEHIVKFVIECDGFDYHSSKEQQIRDQKRETILKKHGYIVLRTSGKMIVGRLGFLMSHLMNILDAAGARIQPPEDCEAFRIARGPLP